MFLMALTGGINERSPLLGPGDDTRDVDLRDGVSDQEEEDEEVGWSLTKVPQSGLNFFMQYPQSTSPSGTTGKTNSTWQESTLFSRYGNPQPAYDFILYMNTVF